MSVMSGVPEDRRLIGQIGANASWANTPDRPARTKPARDAFLRRFELAVDPEGKLPERERRERALYARKARMLRLARLSAQARRIRAGMSNEQGNDIERRWSGATPMP
jgi:hypothetical protein